MAKSVLKSKCLPVQIHEERSGVFDKLDYPFLMGFCSNERQNSERMENVTAFSIALEYGGQ